VYDDEPKHVAHCCIALKCCVWWHTLFVFQECFTSTNWPSRWCYARNVL